jgi:hypothetical protein
MTQLHVSISAKAKQYYAGNKNRAGETLRDWLIRSIESSGLATTTNPALFSAAFEVDEDVPAILGSFSLATNRNLEEIIESWLMEDPSSRGLRNTSHSPASAPAGLSNETLGKAAQILDLVETLFEQTIADAQQKLGGNYPESERVARASAEVFRGLRELLGLRESNERPKANGELSRAVDVTKL